MNRLHGAAAARKVVLAGFVVGLVCSFIGTRSSGPLGPLVSVRVAMGSGMAFLSASCWTWRSSTGCGGELVAGAARVEPVRGARVDTVLFFTVAFSASLALIAPEVDVGWANEAVPLLGARAGGAALGEAGECRFHGQAGAWRRSRWRRSALALGRLAAGALKLPLPFRPALAGSGQPQPAKGGDPMSSETLEREAGFMRGGTA